MKQFRKVNIAETGFKIDATQDYTNKQNREQRMKDRKKRTGKSTIDDVMSYLDDLSDRQSEIYDMITAPK